jgi:hypothetical protein
LLVPNMAPIKISLLWLNWNISWSCIGVWILWWKGPKSHSPHLHIGNKKHHQDEHKPMTEWKAWGFCANAKCPSYDFGPSKRYLGVIGIHLGSFVHPHLPISTKFICDCHKFASRCTLIGSI